MAAKTSSNRKSAKCTSPQILFGIGFTCIFLLFTYSLAFNQSEQNLSSIKVLRERGQLQEAVSESKKLLATSQSKRPQNILYIAKCNLQLGAIFSNLGEMDSSQLYLGAVIESLILDSIHYKETLQRAWLELGNCYGKWGRLDKAKTAFEKLLLLTSENDPLAARALSNIGLVYLAKEEYVRAQEYLEKGVQLTIKTVGEEALSLGFIYNNLFSLHSNLGHEEKALEYLKKAISIKGKVKGAENVSLVSSYINLSSAYIAQAQFDLAINYLELAKKIRLRASGQEHPDLPKIYSSLAECFAEMGNREKSLEYIDKTLSIISQNYQKNPSELAQVFLHLGNVYLKLGDTESAGQCLKKGALALGYNSDAPNRFDNVNDLVYLDYFFELEQKRFRFFLSKNENYSDSIFRSLDDHLDLYDYLLTEPIEDSDRQLRTAFAYPLFESYLLHLFHHPVQDRKQKAFSLMEKSKSRLLSESFQLAKAEHLAGVPDSLLDLEHEQLAMLKENEFLRFAARQAGEADSLIQSYDSEIIRLKRLHQKLIDLFQKKYPSYHQIKYNHNLASLQEVQMNLQQDECLLEYFTGDSSIFILLISPQAVHFERVVRDFPLEKWVRNYRAGLSDFNILAEQNDSIVKSHSQKLTWFSFQLYQKLIFPLKDKLNPKILLVPDGILNFIPFDALLSQAPENPADFANHDYLLRSHLISLHFSASLSLQLAQHPRKAKKDLLAIAPSFAMQSMDSLADSRTRKGLPPLPHTVSEAEQITEIIPGDLLIGSNANKTRFQELAGGYRILHLATHAKANDQIGDYSYIAFSSQGGSADKMFARDLYNSKLNADLVVLSACETGLGELKRGEGVIGLSRAFMYAGAASTVTSLWSVNDAETAVLMADFYRHLRSGASKDEALRSAKLAFLQNHPAPHPGLWAGFVATGDMAPIYESEPWLEKWMIWISLSILLFISILWKITKPATHYKPPH